MRMWSRGLGRQNIGIKLSEVNVMNLDEALDYMLKEARNPLLGALDTQRVIALSGKMLPPTGWEFVIAMDLKDLLAITWKLLSWKTVKSLFFSSAMKREPVESNVTSGSATNRI